MCACRLQVVPDFLEIGGAISVLLGFILVTIISQRDSSSNSKVVGAHEGERDQPYREILPISTSPTSDVEA